MSSDINSNGGFSFVMIGLMTAGGCDCASIGKFRNDWLFEDLLGKQLPYGFRYFMIYNQAITIMSA